MRRTRDRGGVKLFTLFFIILLIVLGGAGYFFGVNPKGRKALAGLLKQFVKDKPDDGGKEPVEPPTTPAQPRPEPENPARQAANVFVEAGRDALKDGNIKFAKRMIAEALAQDPGNPDALILKVKVTEAEMLAEAQPSPEPEPEKGPTPEEEASIERSRAQAFLVAGDIPSAEKHARRAVELAPDSASSRDMLKAVLLAKKQAEKPPAPVEDKKSEASRFVEAAATCEDNEDFASAAAFLLKAIELDPKNSEAARALKRVNNALKREKQNTEKRDQELLSLKAEFEKKLAALEAKKAEPAAPDPEKLALEEELRQLRHAIDQKAAETPSPAEDNQTRAAALLRQAKDFLISGAESTARDVALKALTLDPTNQDVAAFLQKLDDAARVEPPTPAPVEPAAPSPEEQAAAERARAQAFLAAGDIATAERHARRAVELAPAVSESSDLLKAVLLAKKEAETPPVPVTDNKSEAARFVEVARTCEDNQDYASAAAFLRKAIGIDPSNAGAVAALQRVNDALRQERRQDDSGKLQEQLLALQDEIKRTRAELEAKKAEPVTPAAPNPEKSALEEKVRLLEESIRNTAARAASAAEDNKQRALALVTQAKDFLITGALGTAKEVALKALTLDPNNREITALIGRIDEAITKQAAETTPEVAAPPKGPTDQEKALELFTQAKRLFDAGALTTARDLAMKGVDLDPANADIANLLGKIEAAIKKEQEPEPAVVTQPEGPTHKERALELFTQARRLYNAGAFSSARDVILKAMDLDPANADIADLLGKIDAAIKKEHEPEPAVVTQPEGPTPKEKALELFVQAKRLYDVEAFSSAKEVALKAMDLDPANADVAELLRKIEAAMKKPEPTPAVVTQPEGPTPRERALELLAAAKSLHAQGALNSALNTAKKALDLDPRNPEITSFVAMLEREARGQTTTTQPADVEPLPGTTITTTTTTTTEPDAAAERELVKAVAGAIESLDGALETADAEKFLSLLSAELSNAERDNLEDFLRLARNVKVERAGAPTLKKQNEDGTVEFFWPYKLSYEMAGQKIERDIQMTYLLARGPSNRIEVLQTTAAPKAE